MSEIPKVAMSGNPQFGLDKDEAFLSLHVNHRETILHALRTTHGDFLLAIRIMEHTRARDQQLAQRFIDNEHHVETLTVCIDYLSKKIGEA